MRKDEIKKKAQELSEKIKQAEKELEEVRKSCKHSDYKIKDVNFGVGSSNIRKVCKFCDEIIGFPNENDLKNNGYK